MIHWLLRILFFLHLPWEARTFRNINSNVNPDIPRCRRRQVRAFQRSSPDNIHLLPHIIRMGKYQTDSRDLSNLFTGSRVILSRSLICARRPPLCWMIHQLHRLDKRKHLSRQRCRCSNHRHNSNNNSRRCRIRVALQVDPVDMIQNGKRSVTSSSACFFCATLRDVSTRLVSAQSRHIVLV